MKKKKFFSRIFAAALAVAILATTLITNSGAGLLASAAEATYSVKIISPDVPADGKTYSYNFYQIIAGEVEADGDVNLLANPKWGVALGGENFDKVPSNVGEDKPRGVKYSHSENGSFHPDAGIGYYSSSEVLLGALSGYMSCDSGGPGGIGAVKRSSLTDSAHKKYCEILKSYGVFKNDVWLNDANLNFFYEKFNHSLVEDSNKWRFDGKTRDAKGLVELLNAGSIDGKLKTADLKAFAELLLNGVEVEVTTDSEGTKEKYTYNFITGTPQATQAVSSDDGETEYTVENLAPGYYLVACVGEDDKLSNNGYETSMPVKPVSTMLILVGPANKGVTEIVGKNAYTVPTITLDIYQKPVKLKDKIKTEEGKMSLFSSNYANEVEDIEKIIEMDNWEKTGSFDYYSKDVRQEAILYRIGITLPLNFDQYKDSGYFLAVLDQYCHYNATSNNKEIERVRNVRPYIYVKSGSEYTLVGRYMGNPADEGSEADPVIGKYVTSIQNTLTADGYNVTYNKNTDLGFDAHDLFCLGDLYTHTTNTAENGTTTTTHTTVYKPGDTIYIYYPAILRDDNIGVYGSDSHYLLNVNRIWAVYSNNPYAKTLTTANGVGTGSGYSHVVNGEVGVTPIAETNVNTYGVTLKVDGEKGYTNGAKFALYREVEVEREDGTKTKTKEYALTRLGTDSVTYVKEWIPESEIKEDSNSSLYETIVDQLLNYSKNSSNTGESVYLASTSTGIGTSGVKIKGLAAGDYYLQELTISSQGINGNKEWDKTDHDNLKKYHYKLAEEPIKFNVGNKYNDSVSGYLAGKENTFIQKLTVDFKQDNPERAIDTYIDKPLGTDEEGNSVSTKNGSITTTLNESSFKYATEDGQIEIRVYHKTINLIWLPETGGIGTMIFFIVGGTIVVAAVVMIVTRFRVKRERL